MNKLITKKQYIERLPNGYINKKQELLSDFAAEEAMQQAPVANNGTGLSVETTSENMPVTPGAGNGALQRALNREGVS